MPHTLQVSAQAIHTDTRNDYLQTYEIVRGEPVAIEFYVTNLADEDFPGASVSLIVMNYENQASSRYTNFTVDGLPPLKPSEEHVLSGLLIATGLSEGPAWVQLTLKATDDEPITYYQIRDGQPRETNWEGPLYVVNREQLNIIRLLQSMLEDKE